MKDWLTITLERIAQVTSRQIEAAERALPDMDGARDTDHRWPPLTLHLQQMYTYADLRSQRTDFVEQSCKECGDGPKRRDLMMEREILVQERHTLFNMFMLSVQHAYKIRVIDQMIQVRRGWRICLVPNVQTMRLPEATHRPVLQHLH